MLKVVPWAWNFESKKHEIDLSNEVRNIDFGQGALRISEIKVGLQEKF